MTTASERLRELLDGFFEDTEPSGWEAPREVIVALTLIADVVEAAETKVGHETKNGEHWYGSESYACPLCDALTALRDSLGEK